MIDDSSSFGLPNCVLIAENLSAIFRPYYIPAEFDVTIINLPLDKAPRDKANL